MKTKILIVDDLPENILALSHVIESPEIQIVTASSGEEALGLVLDGDFALALIDVQMPGMNGFELARHMRMIELSRTIPIIFVTASEVQKHNIFEGYDHGAVDYLLKPLEAHVVRSKVRVFVDLDHKTKALENKSKLLEQKLHEVEMLKESAESANEAKTRFLANMSHEIRTPLGAVLGFTELLSDGHLTKDERATYIAAIARNGQLLQTLVDNVLDLAKIEAGRVEMERLPVKIDEFIQDIRTVHQTRAEVKGLKLEISVQCDGSTEVLVDGPKLKQILNNLVGNAIKFTTNGTVTVTVAYQEDRKTLSFEITDTGCGLSVEERKRIFKPFVQADNSTTRKFGGTGLGLVISQQLAKLMGGNVRLIRSEINVGSTFIVDIEAPKVEVTASKKVDTMLPSIGGSNASEKKLASVKILIVDDAFDNRLLFRRILQMAGANVDTVENGFEAVDKVTKNIYDVILLDIQMPGMDGYQVIKQLRADGFTRPVIALTAHAMREESTRCMEAGFDAYLTKPVDIQLLISTVKDMALERPRTDGHRNDISAAP